MRTYPPVTAVSRVEYRHPTAGASRSVRRGLILLAREPVSPWGAMAFGEEVPPASLEEARAGRSALTRLLERERSAAADFLLALADFDRRRGWERLGHASLFAFLTRELGLSSGAAQLRLSAARLLPRHPAVEAALRSGRLCISAVGQLARVLTIQNEAAVLPRFLGLSAREAAEVAASILPRTEPPRREVVTLLAPVRWAGMLAQGGPPHAPPMAKASTDCHVAAITADGTEVPATAGAPLLLEAANHVPVPAVSPAMTPAALHTYEVPAPPRGAPGSPAVEPLTTDLRRLHLTVSKGFLEKVAAARTGLSHAQPGATMEAVLEAALDLLLERQAQRKALGRRAVRAVKEARPKPPAAGEAATAGDPTEPPCPPRRPHVPAAIEREVRLRDGGRCQFPLDGGGRCGSTWQVELDHVIPLLLGGATTVANLRCACRFHNQAAAEAELGAALMWPARLPRARQGSS
jgi:hypothetical protein